MHANAHLPTRALEQYCMLNDESQHLLKRAVDSFGFSARAYHRILKVARTIADLDAAGEIQVGHIAEAIQYRTLDRNLWMQ